MNKIGENNFGAPVNASERKLLSIARQLGPIARSEVTAHSELSQQSVHRLIDNLQSKGFLRFRPATIKGRGKPSPSVEINQDTFVSLGLSFTTEKVLACLLDLKGAPLIQCELDVHPNNPTAVLDVLEAKIADWTAAELKNRQMIGVGIAMQGYRTGAADQFETPTLLENWQNLELIPLFQDRFELPVFTENNATCCATAEFYLGGAAEHSCFVYLSFNYGYGAGLYWQNKPVQGGHGNAGEIGSIYRPEDTIHRPALGELLKRMQMQGHAIAHISELPNYFSDDLPVISDWVQEVGPYLRQSLAALKGVMDPTAIFFGGEAPSGLRRALINEANADDRIVHGPDPMLIESRIQGDAAHVGAAFLPLHQLIFRN